MWQKAFLIRSSECTRPQGRGLLLWALRLQACPVATINRQRKEENHCAYLHLIDPEKWTAVKADGKTWMIIFKLFQLDFQWICCLTCKEKVIYICHFESAEKKLSEKQPSWWWPSARPSRPKYRHVCSSCEFWSFASHCAVYFQSICILTITIPWHKYWYHPI